MYQVILFDLDDTLIDFTYSERMGLKNIHAQFYNQVDYAVFEQLYKEINSKLWQQVSAHKHSIMPAAVRSLRFSQLNQRIPCNQSAEHVANAYDKNLCEHAYWIPKVQSAIEFLYQQGTQLGIITNGFVQVQGAKRTKFALTNWFNCYIVSDDVGISKPNPTIFELALQELSKGQLIEKESVLMVGDSLLSDGQGAKNFGIDYCQISTNPVDLEKEPPPIRYSIASVADLPACIGYEEEYDLFLKTRSSHHHLTDQLIPSTVD